MNKNFQKYALVFLNIINNWLEFLTILMLNHELCRARRSRLDYIIYGKSMHYSSLPNNKLDIFREKIYFSYDYLNRSMDETSEPSSKQIPVTLH